MLDLDWEQELLSLLWLDARQAKDLRLVGLLLEPVSPNNAQKIVLLAAMPDLG